MLLLMVILCVSVGDVFDDLAPELSLLSLALDVDCCGGRVAVTSMLAEKIAPSANVCSSVSGGPVSALAHSFADDRRYISDLRRALPRLLSLSLSRSRVAESVHRDPFCARFSRYAQCENTHAGGQKSWNDGRFEWRRRWAL